MCTKVILMCVSLLVTKISAEYIGEDCIPNKEIIDGICTLITDCEVALSAIEQSNSHSFYRCGFSDIIEVVCCPRTTSKFDSSDNKEVERKADRECKKIKESVIPSLDIHIIGGEAATLGEFPHMVAIGYEDREGGYDFDCGGALVSRSYVITAAHCVTVQRFNRTDPTIVRAGVVVLGSNKWHDESDYRISQVILHPEYRRSAKYHDLALIRLERPVTLTTTLNAACLFTANTDPDVPLTITGWGRSNIAQNIKSNVLLKTKVMTVSVSQCSPLYKNWLKLPRGIIDSQICAGDPNGGHDACQGDSGGPLQMTTSQDSQYRIVGITSFGIGCGTTKPGIYTRVSHYLDWIENVVWPY